MSAARGIYVRGGARAFYVNTPAYMHTPFVQRLLERYPTGATVWAKRDDADMMELLRRLALTGEECNEDERWDYDSEVDSATVVPNANLRILA